MTKLPTVAAPKRGDQRGVSLIEVLVTMVVVSLGLLGLAALQMLGLKAAESSHYRASAAFFAQDMVNRLRANAAAARAGNYNLAMTAAPPTTTTNIQDLDRKEWFEAMGRVLPAADGAIAVNGNFVTVTVEWDDRRGDRATAATKGTFVLETDL